MKNVAKYEKIVDEKVLKCYYNICRYYDIEKKIVNKFLKRK